LPGKPRLDAHLERGELQLHPVNKLQLPLMHWLPLEQGCPDRSRQWPNPSHATVELLHVSGSWEPRTTGAHVPLACPVRKEAAAKQVALHDWLAQ
jgi:hypothetical protein